MAPFTPQSSPFLGRLPHQATQDSLETKQRSDYSDDDDDDDLASINLLASPSLLPRRETTTPKASRAAAELFPNDDENENDNRTPVRLTTIAEDECSLTSTGSTSSSLSPATQTLNYLSQSTNLYYDISQLDMDAAATLVQTAGTTTTTVATNTTTTTNHVAATDATIAIAAAIANSLAVTGSPKRAFVQPNRDGDGSNEDDDDDNDEAPPSPSLPPYPVRHTDDSSPNRGTADSGRAVFGATRAKAVCQVDPANNRVIATFDSVRQACLQTKVGKHGIHKALEEKEGAIVEGYLWRRQCDDDNNNNNDNGDHNDYGDDDNVRTKDSDQNRGTASFGRAGFTRATAVCQVDPANNRVIGTFDSVRQASLATNVSNYGIYKALEEKDGAIVEGYLWRRQRDDDDNNIDNDNGSDRSDSTVEEAQDHKVRVTRHGHKDTSKATNITTTTKSSKAQPLQQIHATTGKVIATFPSVMQAAARTNIRRNYITKALNCNEQAGQDAIAGGCRWRRVNEDDDADSDDKTKNKTKDRIATSETATEVRSSAPSAQAPRMVGDYSIHYVTVQQSGSLGLSIIGAKPPPDLCLAFECQDKADAKCCAVDRILDPSIAGNAGVQEGDWFLSADSSKEAIPDLETYSSIIKAAQQAKRPLTFCLARQSKTELVNEPKKKTPPPPADLLVPSSEDEASSGIKRVPTTTALKQDRTSPKPPPTVTSTAVLTRRDEASQESVGLQKFFIDTKTVPFCALCNGRKTIRPVHHAWCPEHGTFEISGAAEILERVQQGALMQCSVCIQEYKDGRILKGAEHSKDCQRNQKMLEAIHAADSPPSSPKKAKTVKKRKPEGSPKKLSRSSAKRVQKSKESEPLRPTSLRGRKIGNSEKSSESEASLSDVGGDDSSHSVYAGREGSRRPIQILRVAKKAPKSAAEQGTAKSRKETSRKESTLSRKTTKFSSTSAPKNTTKKSIGASNNGASTSRKTSTHQSKATSKRLAEAASLQPERTIEHRSHSDYDVVEVDDQTDDAIDVAWESCENPWGPEGHVDDDVVLFAHTTGLGHHETVLPSTRYEADPFSSSKRYGKTHRIPEDGFQALILKRDLLVTRPWGFTCQRHEFGGACLVTSVDPLSPADAAVYLGAACEAIANSGLRVNDMIVSVNGKRVGGMTAAGFEIEVEISGPELVLLVSRYKFATKVQDRIQEAERSYLDAIDKVINDDRLLGWTDIGTTTTPLSGPEMSANLDAAVASPSAITKPKVSPLTINARDENGFSSDESVELVKTVQVEDDTKLLRGFGGRSPSHTQTKLDKAGECSPSHQETKPNKLAKPQADFRVPEATSRIVSIQKAIPEDGAEECAHSWMSFQNAIPITGVDDCAHSQGSMSSQSATADDEAEECAHSQGSMSSQKTMPKTGAKENAGSQESDVSKGAESDWSDDGNAWLGCVCGEIHNEKIPVFWIQCFSCESWYNCSDKCAGFGAKDAETVERWICWGCPVPGGDDCSIDDCSITETPGPPQSKATDLPASHDPICDAIDSPIEEKTIKRLTGDRNLPASHDPICDAVDSPTEDETIKRLTGDGCIRPKSKPQKKEDGTYEHPKGRHPVGFHWNKERGLWCPKEPERKGSSHKPTANKSEVYIEDETTKRLTGDGCIRPKSKPQKKKDGTYEHPKGRHPAGFRWNKERGLWCPKGSKRKESSHKPTAEKRAGSNEGRSASKERDATHGDSQIEDARQGDMGATHPPGGFTKGTLVFIKEHGWAGVNNASGIARVSKSYIDHDGGLLYDVKYIIGDNAKGVLAGYVSLHKFFP